MQSPQFVEKRTGKVYTFEFTHYATRTIHLIDEQGYEITASEAEFSKHFKPLAYT